MVKKTNILVGLAGAAGSGKTQVATYLNQYKDFYHISFADPLRNIVKELFGFSKLQMSDRILKETIDDFWDISPRKAMQLVGTDFARHMITNDFWVLKMDKELHSLSKKGMYNIVIDDVRYDNEKQLIINKGGCIIHINRDDNIHKTIEHNHSSEQGITLDNKCIIINNNSTLHALCNNVIYAIEDFVSGV